MLTVLMGADMLSFIVEYQGQPTHLVFKQR